MTTSIHAFNNRESSQSGIGCRVADSLDTAEGFDRTCCVHTCLVQLERNWTDSNRSAGHKFLGVTQYEDALAHRHILTLTQLGHAKFSRHVGSVALVRASHSASSREHHVQLLQPLVRRRTSFEGVSVVQTKLIRVRLWHVLWNVVTCFMRCCGSVCATRLETSKMFLNTLAVHETAVTLRGHGPRSNCDTRPHSTQKKLGAHPHVHATEQLRRLVSTTGHGTSRTN